MQPVVAVRIDFDAPELGRDEFTGTQARAVAKVQDKAQALRRWRLPAVGSFEAVGDRAYQVPLGRREDAGRVQGNLRR
jgi:hypothetical protein